MDKKTVLGGFQIFSKLSEESLRRFADEMEIIDIGEHQQVFEQNETPQYIHGLLEGRVKYVKYTESGKSLIFGLCDPGQIMAEAPLIGGTNYPTTAITMHPSKLFRIPRKILINEIRQNAELGLYLLNMLSQRVVYLAEKLSQMATHTVEQRIVQILLDLALAHGANAGKGTRFNIDLSRMELSELIGASIETTIRAMSLLKKKNVIDFDRKNILIPDLQDLKNLLTTI